MTCDIYKKIEKGSIFDRVGLRGFLYRNRGNEKLCLFAFVLASCVAIDKLVVYLEEYKNGNLRKYC